MSENSICLFTTIRATLADTLSFVYYHLNIGVDHHYLFFDDPDDPSINVLAQEKRVTCIRCDADYWKNHSGSFRESERSLPIKQRINSQVAFKLAREHAYAWIGHIDVDELIYAKGDFKQAVVAIPSRVDVARFPVWEVIPEKLSVQSAFRELHLFKQAKLVKPKKEYGYLSRRAYTHYLYSILYWKIKMKAAKLLGYHHAPEDFIKGHRMGKSIARTSAHADMWHPHFPFPIGEEPLNTIFHPSIKILHYDAPDYMHWKNKWYRRYMLVQDGIDPDHLGPRRKPQFDDFIRVYEQGNEADLIALYKSINFISPSDMSILKITGLVSEIHMPDALFTIPSDPKGSEKSQQ